MTDGPDTQTRMDDTRWQVLMERMSLPPLPAVFDMLLRKHQERHRAYHTIDHIEACLRHLDENISLAQQPGRIEVAIWFHDAIYQPFSKTNEQDSAQLARHHLSDHLDVDVMHWIERAILLTRDHADAPDSDTALLLDIDLSILATRPDVYEGYVKNVRREYRWVPKPIYRKGRHAVLQSFLDREAIYKTDALANLWEEPARRNISAELERLVA